MNPLAPTIIYGQRIGGNLWRLYQMTEWIISLSKGVLISACVCINHPVSIRLTENRRRILSVQRQDNYSYKTEESASFLPLAAHSS